MKTRVLWKKSMLSILALGVFMGADAALGQRKSRHDTPPDLTGGGQPDDTRDWRLGPLGANGWVFNRNARQGASSLARQTLVTRVDENGPAAAALKVGDVIVGTAG